MTYNPSGRNTAILDVAWNAVDSVPYKVTVRWVFYRLLQKGVYSEKADYKHLIALLSKARKEFYKEWRPWTLADDTRHPVLMQHSGMYHLYLRGGGFKDGHEWAEALKKELNCPLERWASQEHYVEYYYEVAAMQSQFIHHANENVPLLAFKGDCTIVPKWESAQRLAKAYLKYRRPIRIFYFGDYDPKGLSIPLAAWKDIKLWALGILGAEEKYIPVEEMADLEKLMQWIRIGINEEHIEEFDIPENPERPGTYQWEALDDNAALRLIERANDTLDLEAFEDVKSEEVETKKKLKIEYGG